MWKLKFLKRTNALWYDTIKVLCNKGHYSEFYSDLIISPDESKCDVCKQPMPNWIRLQIQLLFSCGN